MMALLASAETGINDNARSSALYNPDTRSFLYQSNADLRLPMASTTKIVTALVAIESLNLDESVTVTKEAVGVEGSSLYLSEGDVLSVRDLLFGVLLQSANDAATVLALHISGSIPAFAEKMTERVRDVGALDTSFQNPHGLDSEEHYTTAHDLSLIAAEALGNETFRQIVSTYKYSFNIGDKPRVIVNHNKLLKLYDGCIGVKTGYTKKSGRCLVSAAERDGVELICVTLNAPDDWRDHSTLLDYGFSTYESRTLCRRDDFKYVQPVVGGDEEYVMLAIENDVTVTVPRACGDIEQAIELPRFSYADIKKGDVMGYLVYTANGEEIARAPIVAQYSVTRVQYRKTLWDRLISLFLR